MIKRNFCSLLLLLAAALTITSCAKKTEESFDEKEQQSLDAWMKIHAPQVTDRWDNGMYVEQIVPPTNPASDPPNVNEANPEWVRVNFTGMSLSGDVFYTRTEEVAIRQGTRTLHTYYEPLYTPFNTSSGLTQGQMDALRTMREGETVRLYLPSRLAYGAYGTSGAYGYQGQNSLKGNVPVIIEMTLVQIVPQPVDREERLVKTYALDAMGFVPNQFIINKEDTLLCAKFMNQQRDPSAKIVRKDTLVNIYYVRKFLDGFIFDTNIDTIAQRVFHDYTTHGAMEYKASSSNTIAAFPRVLYAEIPPSMDSIRYGDSVRMVFTSSLGYGKDGNYPSTESTTAATVIQPYTPLVFELYYAPFE